MPSLDRMIARSRTFSSSRTLPGQWYRSKPWIISGGMPSTILANGLPFLVGQVRDEEREVFTALSQRRHVQRKDIQPVIEIRSEPAGRHLRLEIPVRGGDQPGIDPEHLRRAEPLDLARLQHAQELHLDRLRKLAHLVEEDGPAVCQLEAAGPPGRRPGEGAPFVPEQLTLDEGRRQRRAVHDDEGPVAAAALPVHRSRDELLAGTGFTRDQHRGVGCRHLADAIEQLLY